MIAVAGEGSLGLFDGVLENLDKLARRCRAFVGRLFERSQHCATNGLMHIWVDLAQMRRRVVHLHSRNGNFIVTVKWLPTRQHMKSRDAERVNIAGGREFELARCLFGRHVIHRADTCVGGGENRAAI